MRIKTILLVLLSTLLITPVLQGQKAKFKNLKATCQKTRLPAHYVAPETRTYNLYVKGSYSGDVEPYNKGVYGWTLDAEDPKMEAVISLYGFRINPAKRQARKQEKKDKDGKVTEKWTEYAYTGSAEGKGTLYVYGPDNAFRYKKKDDEKSKAELAKEARAAEEQEKLKENPFLSEEDVTENEDEGESDLGEDSGLDDAMLPLVKTVRVDVSQTVNTRYNRSTRKAYEEYKETERPRLLKLRDTYPRSAYDKALATLNARYGYTPTKYTMLLKRMKTDKHPEFQMWNDACTAAQTLFKSFRYNKSIDDKQPKFGPIVDYFIAKAESISDKDKKGKNMKKAAYHNAATIMYYLDRYEDVLTFSEAQKTSKFIGKTADRLIRKTNRQQALLAFHKMESCHMTELADVDEDEMDGESEEADDEAETAGGQK